MVTVLQLMQIFNSLRWNRGAYMCIIVHCCDTALMLSDLNPAVRVTIIA